MNAVPKILDDLHCQLRSTRMSESDLDEVLKIEFAVFPFPWSQVAFKSALAEGYECWILRDEKDVLVGYFVLMKVIDEVHLLTIAVHPDLHGRGIGRRMMDYLIALSREMKMVSMLLEVRPSNTRALELYKRYGFSEIGRRKNYYAASNGQREEALVMRLPL